MAIRALPPLPLAEGWGEGVDSRGLATRSSSAATGRSQTALRRTLLLSFAGQPRDHRGGVGVPPLDQAGIRLDVASANQVEPTAVHVEVAGPADRIARDQQPAIPVQPIVQLDGRFRQRWMA